MELVEARGEARKSKEERIKELDEQMLEIGKKRLTEHERTLKAYRDGLDWMVASNIRGLKQSLQKERA